MRTFKIWDVAERVYRTRRTPGSAPQSCWDTRSSASRVAGRMPMVGTYEIHTFKLERSYVEGETE